MNNSWDMLVYTVKEQSLPVTVEETRKCMSKWNLNPYLWVTFILLIHWLVQMRVVCHARSFHLVYIPEYIKNVTENIWAAMQYWIWKWDFPWWSSVFLLNACFFAWVVDCGEAKGWLRNRNLFVTPEPDTERGWKWVYVYDLPGRAWCMLMANTCAHWAAVHASVCSGTSLLCMCQLKCVFVLFSMLSDMRLTDSIQSADRARCMAIQWASLGDVFGLDVWPLLSPTPSPLVCLFFYSYSTTSVLTSCDPWVVSFV